MILGYFDLKAARLFAVVLFCLAMQNAVAQDFEGLGDLPGGFTGSNNPYVSGNGQVVVGSSFDENGTAIFRWTQETGMQYLMAPGSIAYGGLASSISYDGSVVTGTYTTENGARAFVWRDGVVTTGVGGLEANYQITAASDVTHDGSKILGFGRFADPENEIFYQDLLVWTEAGGWQVLLSGTDLYYYSFGWSSDGQVMYGYIEDYSTDDPETRYKSYRWTAGGGIEFIDIDVREFIPIGVSANGTTLVGFQNSHAAKWTVSNGFEFLEEIPGALQSRAMAISADARVIAGSNLVSGVNVPTLWEEGVGLRNVEEMLSSLNVDLAGWRLGFIQYISDDGNIVGGSGTNPNGDLEVWRADLTCAPAVGKRLPPECTCAAPRFSWNAGQGILFGGAGNWDPEGPPSEDALISFVEDGFIPVEFLQDRTADLMEVLSGQIEFDLKDKLYKLEGEADCGAVLLVDGSDARFTGKNGYVEVKGDAFVAEGEMIGKSNLFFAAEELRMGETGESLVQLENTSVMQLSRSMKLGETANARLVLSDTSTIILPASADIGSGHTGTLRLEDRANLQLANLGDSQGETVLISVGEGPGSTGRLEFAGNATSSLFEPEEADRTTFLVVGSLGTGTVTLENRTALRVDSLRIGLIGNGSVEVGAGSELFLDHSLEMGLVEGATGSLSIGGAEDITSILRLTGSAFIGVGGTGTLTIGPYSEMTSEFAGVPDEGHITLGSGAEGEGNLVIIGQQAEMFLTDERLMNLVIGDRGRGDFQLTAGGRAKLKNIWVSGPISGFGSAFVGGEGSELISKQLAVGTGQFGLLQVEDDAIVRSDLLWIGPNGQVQGNVLAIGTINDASKKMGGLFAGGLLLSDGAQVDVTDLQFAEDAVIGGTATWTTPVVNAGSVMPGDFNDPTGTFTAGAGYEQAATGVLEIDLDAEGSDKLVVTGTALLNGVLKVALAGDYVPAGGETFTIVEADEITGVFASVEATPGLDVLINYTGTAVELEITAVTVANATPERVLPTVTRLLPNYPNPFSEETRMVFELEKSSQVQLVVYDLLGREVARLFDGPLQAGRHEIMFDAGELPNGTYLGTLTVDDNAGRSGLRQSRHMVLVR